MNIFVTDPDPIASARSLPDKHIVKMPLETCQMLSIVASEKWGHGFGDLPKLDGTPYKTDKGAFRNHPCTVWANSFVLNWRWLITHGLALCNEYTLRYGKVHSCQFTLEHARKIFPTGDPTGRSGKHPTPFARAMYDEFKHDQSIDTFTAYKRYIASKPWVKDNYLRLPERKPDWVS
tara:strand:- start:7098 stop:7628 length:531 start_codon:yes stop_codon:yes gene_type:complete